MSQKNKQTKNTEISTGSFERKKIEILAPAGSFESFRAAITAGADAVYAGGPRFGARAFAQNFTEEQLLEAIDYAHLHGRRFYLTINTLLKEDEIKELPQYLEPLYLGGLDAVIVQDVGVLEVVKNYFPDLEIHASTQMTLTGVQGAEFLKRMGAVRIVPARELSLGEVRDIKAATGMEIECFVHGALCYCYSGQCLLSSLIGGRSGNRGQCAQPCRLPYSASGENGYLLSLKDICTLDLIPELIDAGIDSFKIEGRMKRPEYVAGVTAMYRKYVDRYLENPDKPYHVDKEDKELLMDLFNRGGFHDGYYKQKNGRDMLTPGKPGHIGVAAAKVLSQKGREVRVRALTKIHKGDVFDFSNAAETEKGKKSSPKTQHDITRESGNNYTCGTDCKKGDVITLLAPKGMKVRTGEMVYRIRNQYLLDTISSEYLLGKKQEKIHGFLTLSVGKPAKLIVCYDSFHAQAETEISVSRADKRPLDRERIQKQLLKTGSTEFVFEQLDIELDADAFLPMQQLNELRRTALDALQSEICGSYHRNRKTSISERNDVLLQKQVDTPTQISVLVETQEQLKVIREYAKIGRVYLDCNLDNGKFDEKFWDETTERFRKTGTEVFLALPRIFRKPTFLKYEKQIPFLKSGIFDGILIRTYEEFEFLRKIGFDRKIVLDHNLYVMNRSAKMFWEKENVYDYTIPVELNKQEIGQLGASHGELIVYGHLPVMVSAQCVTAAVNGCQGKPQITRLTDRYRNDFPVRNFCGDCYNVIYNTKALLLFEQKDAIDELKPAGLRLQFTVENQEQTKKIMDLFCDTLDGRQSFLLDSEEFTKGHFRRGIS